MTGFWDTMVWVREWQLRLPTYDRVYHDTGVHRTKVVYADGEVGMEIWTRCGLLADHWKGGRDHSVYIMVHENVAAKFARPCRRCFEVTDDAASV